MGKEILVTGGAGHVGSHVIEQLVEDPTNRVISLDNYFNGSTENHIPGAEYRTGHTKDIERLIPENPSIVYHLGEYARIAPSIKEPDRVIDMNMIGTAAVLEFCRRRKIKKLVYAASSTKFATQGEERNRNIYSYTKAANVDLILNYGVWYGLTYAICYFYNAYGPREKGIGPYATLIAKFQQIYLKGGKFTVDRPGTQRRNFTYVGDLAKGMIMVGENAEGDGYTLGHKKDYTVEEIARAFGGPIEYTNNYSGRAESGQAPDNTRNALPWDTTVDVLDYIKDFIKNNPREIDMQKMSVAA